MGWEALANVAVLGVLAVLAVGLVFTLSGFDRWLDRRHDRRCDHFDIWSD